MLLQECCKKIFNLIDSFWLDVYGADVFWLLKVKAHLDKLEKIQSKVKWKKLRKMCTNSLLEEIFLERFDKHLPNAFCYSKFLVFDNLQILFLQSINVVVF